jgi:hypothetical protein
MKKLTNRAEVLAAIVSIMQQHDINHTKYQVDIYLYLNEDGTGRIEPFQNVGCNSWLNDNHIFVHSLPELETDWTYYVSNIGDIAVVLEWQLHTLKERTAAWKSETSEYMTADEVTYNDVYDFINAHEPLLKKITDAETADIMEYPGYIITAEEWLNDALMDEEDYIL